MRRPRALTAVLAATLASAAAAQGVPADEPAFTEYVAGLLRREIGETSVAVASPLTIKVGELQANLDRIFAFCKRDTKSCSAEIDRYVKGAAEIHKERSAPPSREAVRIVLRSQQYIQAAQSSVGGPGAEIQPHAFIGGLVALPVLDSPRALRMLGPKANEQLGLSAQQVYDLGIANLKKELKPLMEVAKVASRSQIGQLVGDSFHPSRLLLVESWAPFGAGTGRHLDRRSARHRCRSLRGGGLSSRRGCAPRIRPERDVEGTKSLVQPTFPLEGIRLGGRSVTSNPSIERTAQRPLRALWSAAHVER